MTTERLARYLDENQVMYAVLPHPRAFTAQETAATAHVTGKKLAKCVIVKVDGELAMVVLPAVEQVDLDRVREGAGATEAELAREEEFADSFPDCEVGAMPALGNLYGMDVYVSRSLTGEDTIAFDAGTHDELVQMNYADFERLASPTVI